MISLTRKSAAILATSALVSAIGLAAPARAADQLEIMERQIKEMQAQLATLKREHAAEVKRTSAILQRQREEAENNPYGQRQRYIGPAGQGRPGGAAYPYGTPFISGHPNLTGDGRPPSDRGDVMSWKDFQRATKSDEEVNIGGMKIGFPNGRPTIQSSDGAYAFSVGLAFHEDFGGFFDAGPRKGEARGAFNSFTENARRLRIPFTFRYKDWVAAVTPDFGANHNDGYVALYEANLNYTGLRNSILTVGYFQPRVTEEDAESSNDFMTLERPSITDAVRNIAAGDARFSVGGLHYEKRWWVAAYFTGQEWGHRNPSDVGSTYYGNTGGSVSSTGSTMDSQTGGLLRAAGRPVATKDFDLHVGASAISAFRLSCQSAAAAGSANNCTRSASFGQRPEFDIGEANLVSAAVPNATQIWAAGPELGLRWKRLLVKGEYYHIGVQRDNHPSAGFQGWYGAVAYTIFGTPRGYNYKAGAFTAPGVTQDQEFDPATGHWGALEVVGHYSVIDFNSNLNDAKNAIHGGQQTVWQGGFNWYPNRHFRLMLDYSHFITSRNTSAATDLFGRTGNSFEARVQAAF